MSLPVAVDAMGGDHAPAAVVDGARLAVDAGIGVVLVGNPDLIGDTGGIPVHPAYEVIGMADDPGRSVRTRKDASVVRAAELVRDGAASALVGVGNSGATMAAALLRMGRIRGVRRPAITALIPVPLSGGRHTVMLDAGANVDCTAEMLDQFGRMGAAFAHTHLGVASPTVAVLTIGEEAGKGNDLARHAAALLAGRPLVAGGRFAGNAEGRDIFGGTFDVVVCDGFTGNVALKAMEGATLASAALFRSILDAHGVVIDGLASHLSDIDPDEHNGAYLLGVDGVCVIGHGASGPRAVAVAIEAASQMVGAGVVAAIRSAVALPT